MNQFDLQDRLAIFGRFQFEFSTGHLRKDGTRLRVEDKPTRLLSFLLNRAGAVVTRDELQKLLWPDGVHVDYDHGLNKSINKLRFVLGDDRDHPRFIETLPRLGYRFICPVEIVADGRIAPAPIASASVPDAALGRPLAPSPADLPIPALAQRSRKQVIIFLGVAALAIIVGIVPRLVHGSRIGHFVSEAFAARKTPRPRVALHALKIEKSGALDPLDEGFKLTRPLDRNFEQALYNRETNGWDRWRIVTNYQNFYYRPLSSEEKDFALQRDWKLTCVCALESGGGFADVDFAGKGPRFDIELLQEGNRYFVGLTKRISPTIELDQKIEFPGVADVDHPHTYELRYDHLSRTASLWIDGQERASRYPGHRQFQQDLGVMFGVAIYLDASKSSLVTRTVRFEAY